jgi:flagellin
MSFTINTNIAAMNAHNNAMITNRNIDSSLSKLSSGLRINSAADDASGLAIADSLRSQASALGQAIANANDGISIIQIADKAMDEQTKILDTIKTKAIQAAQDGQTTDSRKALQADITRLMQELDNIAGTTSYNGQNLLSGQFTNKSFQIGAYSNQTIDASIGATSSDKIGSSRFETSSTITGLTNESLTFSNLGAGTSYTLESVKISTSAGTGLGALAEVINKNSDMLGGIHASFMVETTGTSAILSGTITGLAVNGIKMGDVSITSANDSKGSLVNAINVYSQDTGVTASVDSRGHIELTSLDGRAIKISGTNLSSLAGLGSGDVSVNAGRLTLIRVGGADIQISGSAANGITANVKTNVMQTTVNLRDIKGSFTADQASAMGFNANANTVGVSAAAATNKIAAGVTTLKGAMAVISIADASLKNLDKIRADLGSVSNQLTSTVNNISVTQVNVKSAESQIRDVDFAAESANFSKNNILAQSGSYAMSQANAVQQNVLKLLQ